MIIIENNVISVKEIIDFTYKGVNIELTKPFEINISEPSFIIKNLPKNTNWTCNDGKLIERKGFLYCKDVNGNLFTLLDCEIIPNNWDIFLHSLFIVWNKMIYGCHIENEESLSVKKIECTINDEKVNTNMVIGRGDYKIHEGEIEVHAERNDVEGKMLGVKFLLESKEAKSFSYLYKAFQNLMCVYYFYIGYFPSKIEVTTECNNKKIIVHSPNRSIYNTLNKFKDFKYHISYKVDDLSIQYEKWIELYEENRAVFHMFFNAQYNSDAFSEMITCSLIQCLESFYSSFNDTKKFSDEKRNEMVAELNAQVTENEKIINILAGIDTYSVEDLKHSLNGLLGRLNILSLSQIIDNILNSEEGQIVFEYEHSQSGALKKIKDKLYNHRNFITHINHKTKYFHGEENKFIQNRLILLFRAFVLSKLEAKYNKESLRRVNEYIEATYRN